MSVRMTLWVSLVFVCCASSAWSQPPAPDAPEQFNVALVGRLAPLTRYDVSSIQTLNGAIVEPVSSFDQALVGLSLIAAPAQQRGALVGDDPLWMSWDLLFGLESSSRFAMVTTILAGYVLYDTTSLDGGYCGALRARIYSDKSRDKSLGFVHMEALGGCFDLSITEELTARAAFTAGVGPIFPTPSSGLITASGTAQLNLRYIFNQSLLVDVQSESSLIMILDDPRGPQPSLWSMLSLGVGITF